MKLRNAILVIMLVISCVMTVYFFNFYLLGLEIGDMFQVKFIAGTIIGCMFALYGIGSAILLVQTN